VRLNLVASFSPAVRERLLAGPRITVRDLDSGRTFSADSFATIVLPIVASFLFFFATMSAASYMLRVVADEKENRTIEVVITSVTPAQLIGGKAAGLLAATLTQLLIYLVTVAAGLAVAAPRVAALRQVAVPWAYLGLMALFFLPAYVLVSAIMIAVGAAVTEVQQGQQVGAILNLLFMIPIFILPVLIENPGHPAAVFMTLFPITSFLTISLRWGLGTIPAWQLGVSWVLLSAAAIGLVWAAAGILRVGMLRYGQPLTLRAAAAAIRRRGR
jgi:ABC-2 type transport system permease protein